MRCCALGQPNEGPIAILVLTLLPAPAAAQLAYDVGPGEVYPGLEGATEVPALPAAGVLLLAFLRMWRGRRVVD